MNISFNGASIYKSFTSDSNPAVIASALSGAEQEGKQMVKDGKADCFISYEQYRGDGMAADVVLLTNEDAKPLLYAKEIAGARYDHYDPSVMDAGKDEELLNVLPEEQAEEFRFNRMVAYDAWEDLNNSLEKMGHFKALYRGDRLTGSTPIIDPYNGGEHTVQ